MVMSMTFDFFLNYFHAWKLVLLAVNINMASILLFMYTNDGSHDSGIYEVMGADHTRQRAPLGIVYNPFN